MARVKGLIIIFILGYSIAFSQHFVLDEVKIVINSSFRGLSVVDDHVAWVSGTGGWVGRSRDGGKSFTFRQVPGFEKFDFRSLYAFDSLKAIVANAGAPSSILVTQDGGLNWKEVYRNEDKDSFFDGIDFWNAKEGIIYGDPINGKMLLLFTDDGGITWKEIPTENRPTLIAGEASFAASGTGIRCLSPQTLLIATGGKVSRLWLSQDRGRTWKTMEPTILQGESSKGIFSVAALDIKSMIVVGGDFKKDTTTMNQAAYTVDGGNQWKTTLTGGYRECVEFISKSLVVATGPGGTDISENGGKDWKSLSATKGFHVVRKARKGSLVLITGKNQINLFRREK